MRKLLVRNIILKLLLIEEKEDGLRGNFIQLNDIQNYTYDKIIIMVRDIQECINIVKQLINICVGAKKIIVGYDFCDNYLQNKVGIEVLPDGALLITFEAISLKERNKDEFDGIGEAIFIVPKGLKKILEVDIDFAKIINYYNICCKEPFLEEEEQIESDVKTQLLNHRYLLEGIIDNRYIILFH